MFLQSNLLSQIPGLIHGFGTRDEPIPSPLLNLWNKAAPIWKQVHGTQFARIESPNQQCGQVDALYTFKPGIPIAVVTADCVPILLARKSGEAVAAVHAGWRGTRARILEALWRELSRLGEKPCDWVAAIGPAIGPCCYEVSPDLAEDFALEFGAEAVPTIRHLDLPAINAAQLRKLGISEVEIIRSCTRCTLAPAQRSNPPAYLHYSYRREGGGIRQWSTISIQAK